MKENIHPKYMKCAVRCGCGANWETRSTVKEIKVEVCSSCHPFYTGGGDKLIDTLGRVERFNKKFGGQYFKPTAKKDRSKRS